MVDAYLACAERFNEIRRRACADLTHPRHTNLEKKALQFMDEQGYPRLVA